MHNKWEPCGKEIEQLIKKLKPKYWRPEEIPEHEKWKEVQAIFKDGINLVKAEDVLSAYNTKIYLMKIAPVDRLNKLFLKCSYCKNTNFKEARVTQDLTI